MIVGQAYHLESGQVAVWYILPELAVPFLETPVVGIVLIEAAEVLVRVVVVVEDALQRNRLNNSRCKRVADWVALLSVTAPMLFTRKP
jgi:hypothetical protein